MSGQVRTLDASGVDVNGDEVSFSVLDDGLVALPATALPEPILLPARALLLPSVPPPGRLVISDLFRPPMSTLG